MTVTAQATFAATLVDEWVRSGVKHAVVAPGSRSTPLTLALAADGRIQLHVHLDERVAGFFALGIGLATGVPAVVVTTSGTAAVELHPAIVEASQARVPLIACTADRPPELQSVGAPQTIVQRGLFGEAVRWFVEPGPADGLPPSHWRSIASRMVVEATAGPGGPGPVHANLAFRDPLVGEAGELPAARPDSQPWHAAPVLGWLGPRLAMGARENGLFIAGAGCDAATVLENARVLGWPVLADPRSGLRGQPMVVCAFDAILRSDAFVGAHVPAVVARVGAPPSSKVLAQWLAALPPTVDQTIVDAHGAWPDPERAAVRRLPALAPLGGEPRHPTAWSEAWLAAEDAAQRAIEEVLTTHAEATEPGVIRALTRDLPSDTTLVVSSSMPIRDIEWFGHPRSAHRVLANRGANGIDGVVSTALGVAASDPMTSVVAIVGDLAFLYDSSALVWSADRELDLAIVVIDNGGGGIFSFLPQRDALTDATFEQFFGTPHRVDIAALAAAHGIPMVDDARDGHGLRLVHVRTDRDANVKVHAELNAAVARAIDAAL